MKTSKLIPTSVWRCTEDYSIAGGAMGLWSRPCLTQNRNRPGCRAPRGIAAAVLVRWPALLLPRRGAQRKWLRFPIASSRSQPIGLFQRIGSLRRIIVVVVENKVGSGAENGSARRGIPSPAIVEYERLVDEY